jgi:hypothetical protein
MRSSGSSLEVCNSKVREHLSVQGRFLCFDQRAKRLSHEDDLDFDAPNGPNCPVFNLVHAPTRRLRFRRAFFSTIALFVFCQMASAKTLHEGRMHSHHTLDISGKGKPTDTLVTIPKLLHYIYLPGLQAYKTESNKPESRIPSKHFEGCQKIHTHWDSLFWDEVMGLQLVKEFYPWFLPVWEGYDGWGKQVSSPPPPPSPLLSRRSLPISTLI